MSAPSYSSHARSLREIRQLVTRSRHTSASSASSSSDEPSRPNAPPSSSSRKGGGGRHPRQQNQNQNHHHHHHQQQQHAGKHRGGGHSGKSHGDPPPGLHVSFAEADVAAGVGAEDEYAEFSDVVDTRAGAAARAAAAAAAAADGAGGPGPGERGGLGSKGQSRRFLELRAEGDKMRFELERLREQYEDSESRVRDLAASLAENQARLSAAQRNFSLASRRCRDLTADLTAARSEAARAKKEAAAAAGNRGRKGAAGAAHAVHSASLPARGSSTTSGPRNTGGAAAMIAAAAAAAGSGADGDVLAGPGASGKVVPLAKFEEAEESLRVARERVRALETLLRTSESERVHERDAHASAAATARKEIARHLDETRTAEARAAAAARARENAEAARTAAEAEVARLAADMEPAVARAVAAEEAVAEAKRSEAALLEDREAMVEALHAANVRCQTTLSKVKTEFETRVSDEVQRVRRLAEHRLGNVGELERAAEALEKEKEDLERRLRESEGLRAREVEAAAHQGREAAERARIEERALAEERAMRAEERARAVEEAARTAQRAASDRLDFARKAEIELSAAVAKLTISADAVGSLLTCTHCAETLDLPVMCVPCGHHFCQMCAIELEGSAQAAAQDARSPGAAEKEVAGDEGAEHQRRAAGEDGAGGANDGVGSDAAAGGPAAARGPVGQESYWCPECRAHTAVRETCPNQLVGSVIAKFGFMKQALTSLQGMVSSMAVASETPWAAGADIGSGGDQPSVQQKQQRQQQDQPPQRSQHPAREPQPSGLKSASGSGPAINVPSSLPAAPEPRVDADEGLELDGGAKSGEENNGVVADALNSRIDNDVEAAIQYFVD